MPNYNRDTGIPYGVIAVASLDPDFIYEEIDKMESPELDEAYREAARDAAGYLLAKGEITCEDLDCEEGDEEFAIAEMTDMQVIDLVEGINPNFTQSFYDEVDEGEYRKFGEIEGVRVSVASLGGAPLMWIEDSPHLGWYRKCSPCIPQAGDLDSPAEEGDYGAVYCYCTPPDWLRKD